MTQWTCLTCHTHFTSVSAAGPPPQCRCPCYSCQSTPMVTRKWKDGFDVDCGDFRLRVSW